MASSCARFLGSQDLSRQGPQVDTLQAAFRVSWLRLPSQTLYFGALGASSAFGLGEGVRS